MLRDRDIGLPAGCPEPEPHWTHCCGVPISEPEPEPMPKREPVCRDRCCECDRSDACPFEEEASP